MKKKSTGKSVFKGFILGIIFALIVAIVAVPLVFVQVSGVSIKELMAQIQSVGISGFLQGEMNSDGFSMGVIGGADGPTAIIVGENKGDSENGVEELTASSSLSVATDLIKRYEDLSNLGIVCDYEKLANGSREYEEADSLISEDQRMVIGSAIYKCTCCKTIDEAKAHRNRIMGESIIFPMTDLYLTNSNGLYILSGAMGFSSYTNVKVESFNENEIIATADELDSGDNYYRTQKFQIEINDGEGKITSVTEG